MIISKRLAIYNRYNGHCAYCGQHMKQKNMTVDHYVPQSKGGGNNIENLMPCCSRCNAIKALITCKHSDFVFSGIVCIHQKWQHTTEWCPQ